MRGSDSARGGGGGVGSARAGRSDREGSDKGGAREGVIGSTLTRSIEMEVLEKYNRWFLPFHLKGGESGQRGARRPPVGGREIWGWPVV